MVFVALGEPDQIVERNDEWHNVDHADRIEHAPSGLAVSEVQFAAGILRRDGQVETHEAERDRISFAQWSQAAIKSRRPTTVSLILESVPERLRPHGHEGVLYSLHEWSWKPRLFLVDGYALDLSGVFRTDLASTHDEQGREHFSELGHCKLSSAHDYQASARVPRLGARFRSFVPARALSRL